MYCINFNSISQLIKFNTRKNDILDILFIGNTSLLITLEQTFGVFSYIANILEIAYK